MHAHPGPAGPGRFVNRIWDNVPATRARIAELGGELLRHQVQMVTVQLVSASQARNLKGRPKTELDAMWLARLTQWRMLRPSFVPPAAIRAVRDFTRARADLVRERTRVLQRLEKLLEDAIAGHVQAELIFDRGRKGLRFTAFVVDVS